MFLIAYVSARKLLKVQVFVALKKKYRETLSKSQSLPRGAHYRATKISDLNLKHDIADHLGTGNIPEVGECSANWLAEEIAMFGGRYEVLALPQETISLRP